MAVLWLALSILLGVLLGAIGLAIAGIFSLAALQTLWVDWGWLPSSILEGRGEDYGGGLLLVIAIGLYLLIGAIAGGSLGGLLYGMRRSLLVPFRPLSLGIIVLGVVGCFIGIGLLLSTLILWVAYGGRDA